MAEWIKKAGPTASEVHIRRPLTNISIAYMQSADNFIARRVFPSVPVEKDSDRYFTFDRDYFWRDQMEKRAEGGESAGANYKISDDSYSCDVWALHHDITDRRRANEDNPLNSDRNATQLLTQQSMIRMERDWVDKYMGTGIWTTEQAGDPTPTGTEFLHWDDDASDPIGVIDDAKVGMAELTGYLPNKLVLGYRVFMKLKEHPEFRERIKYTGRDSVTTRIMSEMFEVEDVLVPRSVVATNNEGAALATSFIHGKQALLCYSAPTPAVEMPSAGYHFEWTGVSQGFGQTVAISKIRADLIKSDRIEIETAWDNKVVSADLGHFFDSAIS